MKMYCSHSNGDHCCIVPAGDSAACALQNTSPAEIPSSLNIFHHFRLLQIHRSGPLEAQDGDFSRGLVALFGKLLRSVTVFLLLFHFGRPLVLRSFASENEEAMKRCAMCAIGRNNAE